jgi:hypothetical protein
MKRGRVPEDPSGVGRRPRLRLRAFIVDVTLAVEAEVKAIGRPNDQDGRETK